MWELFVQDKNDGWKLYGKYRNRNTACGLSTRFMNRGLYFSTVVIKDSDKGNWVVQHIRECAKNN